MIINGTAHRKQKRLREEIRRSACSAYFNELCILWVVR